MSALAIKDASGDGLYIGRMPGRKKQALCLVTHAGSYDPIAYFRDDKAAEAAKDFLETMFNAKAKHGSV